MIEAPKTAKGRRQIALSPAAVLALRTHRERQEVDCAMMELPLTEDRLVLSYPDGSPMRPETVTPAFTRLVRREGLAGARLHDLRHIHATLMLKANVHPKIVSERLGHATVSITLDLYSHVTPGIQEAAALRFDDAIAPAQPVAAPQATPQTV